MILYHISMVLSSTFLIFSFFIWLLSLAPKKLVIWRVLCYNIKCRIMQKKGHT